LLGYTREEVVRLDIETIVVPDPTKALEAYAHLLREGQGQGEVTLRTREGRVVPAEARTMEVPRPDGSLYVLMLRDITERKTADEALRTALENAQAATQAKDVFLDLMSHELRTPLQAVLGYSEFLLLASPGSLTGEQREDIGYIHHAGDRMVSLINQALELSRLGAGGITLTAAPVDMAQVIEAVRQDIAPQAAAKNLMVVIELPPSLPTVMGDGERVRQILLNLVGNAVKFTDAGHIRITASATASGGLEVVVSDTGIGMAPEALPHIFEAFHQVPGGTTRRHGGSGLGLAIAARLVDQMAGSIDVSSEPGVGTIFRLQLPGG
jgi:signal transduction histidine kinase